MEKKMIRYELLEFEKKKEIFYKPSEQIDFDLYSVQKRIEKVIEEELQKTLKNNLDKGFSEYVIDCIEGVFEDDPVFCLDPDGQISLLVDPGFVFIDFDAALENAIDFIQGCKQTEEGDEVIKDWVKRFRSAGDKLEKLLED